MKKLVIIFTVAIMGCSGVDRAVKSEECHSVPACLVDCASKAKACVDVIKENPENVELTQ